MGLIVNHSKTIVILLTLFSLGLSPLTAEAAAEEGEKYPFPNTVTIFPAPLAASIIGIYGMGAGYSRTLTSFLTFESRLTYFFSFNKNSGSTKSFFQVFLPSVGCSFFPLKTAPLGFFLSTFYGLMILDTSPGYQPKPSGSTFLAHHITVDAGYTFGTGKKKRFTITPSLFFTTLFGANVWTRSQGGGGFQVSKDVYMLVLPSLSFAWRF